MVGVVALIVVGPERLPELARTAGRWLGTARRMVGTFKADLEREMRAEELKKILEKQSEFKSAYEIVEETRQDLKSTVEQLNSPIDAPQPGAPEGVPSPTPVAPEAVSSPPPGALSTDGAGGPTPQPSTPDAHEGKRD